MFDIGFFRGVMPGGLRRHETMIQMHHASHQLYYCTHTNKNGVKHTKKVAYFVHLEYLKPRGQTGLIQLTVPSKHFTSLLKIRSQNSRSE